MDVFVGGVGPRTAALREAVGRRVAAAGLAHTDVGLPSEMATIWSDGNGEALHVETPHVEVLFDGYLHGHDRPEPERPPPRSRRTDHRPRPRARWPGVGHLQRGGARQAHRGDPPGQRSERPAAPVLRPPRRWALLRLAPVPHGQGSGRRAGPDGRPVPRPHEVRARLENLLRGRRPALRRRAGDVRPRDRSPGAPIPRDLFPGVRRSGVLRRRGALAGAARRGAARRRRRPVGGDHALRRIRLPPYGGGVPPPRCRPAGVHPWHRGHGGHGHHAEPSANASA